MKIYEYKEFKRKFIVLCKNDKTLKTLCDWVEDCSSIDNCDKCPAVDKGQPYSYERAKKWWKKIKIKPKE